MNEIVYKKLHLYRDSSHIYIQTYKRGRLRRIRYIKCKDTFKVNLGFTQHGSVWRNHLYKRLRMYYVFDKNDYVHCLSLNNENHNTMLFKLYDLKRTGMSWIECMQVIGV